MFGDSAWKRENWSDKWKVFNPEEHVELVCRTSRRFALGKAVKDGLNYEDNFGKTPMGAKGLYKVENSNNEKRKKQISLEWRIGIE